MQVLDSLNRATGAVRDMVARAGISIRDDNEVVIIVPQETMQALMYASRDIYQYNFVLSDDAKRSSFGIKFNGVLLMTKEDYNARYQQ